MDKYEKALRDATEVLIQLHCEAWSNDLPKRVSNAQREWDAALEAIKIKVFQEGLIYSKAFNDF